MSGLSCVPRALPSSLRHAGSFLSWHVGSTSLSRVWTRASCIGSAESQPPNQQGSPLLLIFNFTPLWWESIFCRISVIFFIFIFLFGNGIPIVLSLLRHLTMRSALERLPVPERSCQLAVRRPCRAKSTDSVVPIPVSFWSAVLVFIRPWRQAIDCRQAPEIILGLSMPPFTCPFVCTHFGAPALCVHTALSSWGFARSHCHSVSRSRVALKPVFLLWHRCSHSVLFPVGLPDASLLLPPIWVFDVGLLQAAYGKVRFYFCLLCHLLVTNWYLIRIESLTVR